MMLKKNLFHYLLLVISMSLSIGIAEGFLRWYYYRWNNNLSVPFLLFYRSYPQGNNIRNFIQASTIKGLLFEFKPNVRSVFKNHPLYTNSKGLIGEKEYILQKPTNVFRIAGIGDSYMSSWGVHPDETYLSILEKKLSSLIKSKKVEILNFAVPGYNTAQEKEVLFSKALAYNPDFVIIGFVGNDMDMPNYIRKKVTSEFYLHYFVKNLIGHLKVLTTNNYNKSALSTELTDSPTASNNEYRFEYELDETPKEYKYMVGYANYLRIMNEIAAETVHKHIPALVVFEYIPYQDMANQVASMGFYTLDMGNEIDKYTEKNNIPYESLKTGNIDAHFNANGHHVWADLIYDHLASLSSIPR